MRSVTRGDEPGGGAEASGGWTSCRVELEIDQAMRVIEGWTEHLPARQILERRGDAPTQAIAPVSNGSQKPKRGKVVR